MMTKLPVLALLLSTASLQTLGAQDVNAKPKATTGTKTNAKAADGRKALAARVAKAHRGDAKTAIDRYTATITIKPRGKVADTVNVQLEVKYGRNIERAEGVTDEMIRYTVNEGDKPMERGKDPRPWVRVGKVVTSLSGRHESTDAELLDSHTRLCRQMLQLLDAGAILAGLDGEDPVETKSLKVSRTETIETDFITGKLKSFPVFRKGSKKAHSNAVFMEAWVAKKDSRLAAVRIFPLTTKGVPDRAQGEFIALSKYADSKGVLVPTKLLIYSVNAKQRKPQVEVSLAAFEVNAKLTKMDFRRPK